jgi:hypothetical protein
VAVLVLAFLIAQPPPAPPVDYPPGELWADVINAPPESDGLRFPPYAVAARARMFNWQCRQRIAEERDAWPESAQWRFDVTLAEARELYAAWDCLEDAQSPYRAWWRRRLDLARLRKLIGDDAYSAGAMPPVVPSHRFRELK